MDMNGIQSDKAQGLGRIKSASFAAIRDVLEKVVVIEFLQKQISVTKKTPGRSRG